MHPRGPFAGDLHIRILFVLSRSSWFRYSRLHFLPPHLHPRLPAQVYSADEAFVTGTFAGVIPVVQVDGRIIGKGKRGPIAARLQQLHAAFVEGYCVGGRRVIEEPS